MKLTVEIKVRQGKFQELYQTLQTLLPVIRREKECRACRFYRDVEDEEILFLVVHWETEGGLEHYLRSASGSAFLGAVDLLGETVTVAFGQYSLWEGIDTLKRMRKMRRKGWGAPSGADSSDTDRMNQEEEK